MNIGKTGVIKFNYVMRKWSDEQNSIDLNAGLKVSVVKIMF